MQLHEMLGRRFEFVPPLDGPDFTVVSYETVKRDCYVHTADGQRAHLDLKVVLRCMKAGTIQESARAPFSLDRPGKYVTRGRQSDLAANTGRPR